MRPDESQAAADFVQNYLWNHDATGVTYSGGTRTLQHSGLAQIYAGQAAADFFGVPVTDPRHRVAREGRSASGEPKPLAPAAPLNHCRSQSTSPDEVEVAPFVMRVVRIETRWERRTRAGPYSIAGMHVPVSSAG